MHVEVFQHACMVLLASFNYMFLVLLACCIAVFIDTCVHVYTVKSSCPETLIGPMYPCLGPSVSSE